jgi:hypothetical protein
VHGEDGLFAVFEIDLAERKDQASCIASCLTFLTDDEQTIFRTAALTEPAVHCRLFRQSDYLWEPDSPIAAPAALAAEASEPRSLPTARQAAR